MLRKILTLGRHTLVYGLGSLGTRLIGFLLIPVYTRYMSPADYGVLALCTTTASVLKILTSAGIPSAVFRTYLLTAEDDTEREKVFGTGLLVVLGAGLAVLVPLVLLARPAAGLLLGSPDLFPFILLLAALNFAGLFSGMRNADFRMRDQSERFTAVTLATFTLNLILALVLVVGLGQGALGAMTANTLAAVGMALLFLPWTWRRLSRGLSARLLRDLLGYGLPLIPAGLAIWVMNLSDIYVLRAFRSTDEIGLYNLGYRFGLGIYMLTNAFKLAFPKVVFGEAADPAAHRLFSRIATYYVAGLGWLCTLVAVTAPEIIRIADPRFRPAWVIIPLAVFAYFFFGLVSILQIGMDITRKVNWLATLFVCGAALNLGSNLLAVPRWGMVGAAVTTLLTYLLLAAAVRLVSQWLYPLPLEWRRLLISSGSLASLALAAWMVAPHGLVAALGVKVGILLAYPLLLLVAGFLTPEERRVLERWRRTASSLDGQPQNEAPEPVGGQESDPGRH